MQSIELTKPVTTESLLSEFESRFNQTMDLNKFTREELDDTANKIRTKIHNITKNEHFGQELKNHNYQKNQMMLDVVNQKIKEYGMGGSEIKKDPETQKTVDKITGIVMEAVENKQANSAKEDNGELEAGENEETILEEVDNG